MFSRAFQAVLGVLLVVSCSGSGSSSSSARGLTGSLEGLSSKMVNVLLSKGLCGLVESTGFDLDLEGKGLCSNTQGTGPGVVLDGLCSYVQSKGLDLATNGTGLCSTADTSLSTARSSLRAPGGHAKSLSFWDGDFVDKAVQSLEDVYVVVGKCVSTFNKDCPDLARKVVVCLVMSKHIKEAIDCMDTIPCRTQLETFAQCSMKALTG